ncbi:MAG: DNA-3-methyladenine glycosylase 2 family protein [Pelagibacteraceae bacterium]|nr:DNA-3-methyladenine glycosylase 2 family protein [Pelagibacteraceae bacterium]MBT4645533.1 DNA-3-methyladenine glycosylase 2 family protein [Pelagibacteraceae bacterium]
MKPKYWNKGVIHLSNNDKVLKKIIDKFSNQSLKLNNNSFHALINSIIGQQISVSAANSMKTKLFSLKKNITPLTIKNIKKTDLRKCGLSKQKILYINNIAIFFLENKKFIKEISKKDDLSIREKLIEIKGIGNWTVDMFLLFTHGSSDIFPSGDLGFIKAISKHYKKDLPLSDKFLKKLQRKWSPYSSIATWYLWRSLDPIPVSY